MMKMRIVAPMLMALVLAGCGRPDTTNEAAANAAANASGEGNALATVLAMPEKTRNVVFVRAIMDAGMRCDGVIKSERADPQQGQPAWRAECQNGTKHYITISPDGTAKVTSVNQR